jgi:nicotinamide phosphoribosyltransferase
MMTSATTAFSYLKEQKQAFNEAGVPDDLLLFMCHDFSFRGMFGLEAATISGLGHLTSFAGTDTVPAILAAEKYYGADVQKELVGASVNATERAVATSSIICNYEELLKCNSLLYSNDELMLIAEKMYMEHLLNNVSPTGILSYVSDSYDFWGVISYILPELKDTIMNRNGKLVIRPDSGDPVKILTGYQYEIYDTEEEFWDFHDYPEAVKIGSNYFIFECNDSFRNKLIPITEIEIKGLIEALWDIFGGSETYKGYKTLDSHIGAIYGDSITLKRQKQINERLMDKGFAPEVVLGVGSYSYQYVTRDTHGSAMKATNISFGDFDQPIYKDPKTDTSKKSAKELIKVVKENGIYVAHDQQTRESYLSDTNCLEVVYLNGQFVKTTTLKEIRSLVHSQA